MLSQKFIEKLKLWHEPQYKIATRAGIHPGMLSKWVIGAQPVKIGDSRLLKVGELIGLNPEDVFKIKDEGVKRL